MPDQEKSRKYFAKANYASPDSPATRRYATAKIRLIEQHLLLSTDISIIDVGCGNGVFSTRLEEKCGFVVGADISQHMLQRNPLRQKVQCDACALPFSNKSFDIAFEANLLHHASREDRERVINEMMRVSRSHVIFVEPNVWNPLILIFCVLVWVERGALVFTPGYMKHLLASCGVQLESVFSTGMITQNRTPSFLLPVLGLFDFKFPFGEYTVAVGRVC